MYLDFVCIFGFYKYPCIFKFWVLYVTCNTFLCFETLSQRKLNFKMILILYYSIELYQRAYIYVLIFCEMLAVNSCFLLKKPHLPLFMYVPVHVLTDLYNAYRIYSCQKLDSGCDFHFLYFHFPLSTYRSTLISLYCKWCTGPEKTM